MTKDPHVIKECMRGIFWSCLSLPNHPAVGVFGGSSYEAQTCSHISVPAPKIARARRAKVTKAMRVGGITISWEMGLRLEDSYGTQANKQDPHLKVKRKWRVFTKN